MAPIEEQIQVIVRCRPMNELEEQKKCQVVLSMAGPTCVISKPDGQRPEKKPFTYDRAYPENSTTGEIYTDIVSPVIQSVTEGYNGTIFAYGQTSCGKTYTMQGVQDPETQHGIIPRSIGDVFRIMASSQDQFVVHASCYEIYNEDIRDLLGKNTANRLDTGSFPNKGFYVKGLSKHPVTNVQQCEQLITKGLERRSTGSTLMNEESSRSHTIFSICVEVQGEGGLIRAGKLNLVDLAGSERQSKSGATGQRLKEGIKINLSLHTLGRVISTLAEGKCQPVPYRESKLTKLLQDSLGGSARTLMVACVSPADYNYEETLSTLRFASRAKKIVNKPVINEDPKDALLKEYEMEIKELRAKLAEAGNVPQKIPDADLQDLLTQKENKREEEFEKQKAAMEKEHERKLAEMKKQLEEERKKRKETEENMKRTLEEERRKQTAIEESKARELEEVKLQHKMTEQNMARELEEAKNLTRMMESHHAQTVDDRTAFTESEQGVLMEIEEQKSLQRDAIDKVQNELLLMEREKLEKKAEEDRQRQEAEMRKIQQEMDEMLEELRNMEERKSCLMTEEQEKRKRKLQQEIENEKQKEKEIKAKLETEMDEKRYIYERELKAAQERAEELRLLRERDIEEARESNERQLEEERRRVALIRQEKEEEMRRLEEKAKAENEKRKEEDEMLARAVHMIAQQDYEDFVKTVENEAYQQPLREATTDWACWRCTFLNTPNRWRCKMCGARHSDASEYSLAGHVIGSELKHMPEDRHGSPTPLCKKHGSPSPLQEIHVDPDGTCEKILVLIGRPGSGKSATGNTILGNQVFESSVCRADRRKCHRGTGTRFGCSIEVIEYPVVSDRIELIRCLAMTAPGPHAFIFIVPIGRFTQEDQDILEHLQRVFGKHILNYLIILFSKKDDMMYDGMSFRQYRDRVPLHMKSLLQSCNNRCVAFNNRGSPKERDADVKELLELVDHTSYDNSRTVFKNEMYIEAEKFIQDSEDQLRKKNREIVQTEKNEMKLSYEKKLQKAERDADSVICPFEKRIKHLETDLRRKQVADESESGWALDDVMSLIKELDELNMMVKNVKEELESETMRLWEEMEMKEDQLNQKEEINFRDQVRQLISEEDPDIMGRLWSRFQKDITWSVWDIFKPFYRK